MVCNTTSFNPAPAARRRWKRLRAAGMSTVETLIALGISLVLLTQVCALWYYSSRSFAAQAAYTALDQDSQRALDRLSKDVRQAQDIRSFSDTAITLRDAGGADLIFRLAGKALQRVQGTTNTVLLNNVDSLKFSMYQKTPVEGAWQQYATTNLATCKMIEVRWKCSRKLHPRAPQTTEYMQSAKIVMRSKQ